MNEIELKSSQPAGGNTTERLWGWAMVTLDEFSHVVSEIYASPITPTNWTAALSDTSRILGAVGSGIIVTSGNNRWPLCATVPTEALASYQAYYSGIDYVLADVESGPIGLVRGGAEIIQAGAGTEFDADWMRPHALQDGLFVRLAAGITTTSFFVAATKGSEPFDTAERVRFVSALVRHFQQALHTQDHLAELGNAAGAITGAIDAIRHGIVIVGTGRNVVHLNLAAEEILKASDGLCIRSGSIAATRTADDTQLQRSITHALVAQRSGARSGNTFACSRASGKRPYAIHALPLTATSDDPSTANALLLIIDPEQEHEPPKALVQRLFGLTNAEADVALCVMRGDGLKPIAAELALSRATVNTHLQHIFAKTDTHRQAELVRLLLAIMP